MPDFDEWEQIYFTSNFSNFIGNYIHLQFLRDGTFQQTQGGGPDGGQVVSRDGVVYSVMRNWNEPYKVIEKHEDKVLQVMTDERSGLDYCLLTAR